jgi:hypothetical protein
LGSRAVVLASLAGGVGRVGVAVVRRGSRRRGPVVSFGVACGHAFEGARAAVTFGEPSRMFWASEGRAFGTLEARGIRERPGRVRISISGDAIEGGGRCRRAVPRCSEIVFL